METHTNLINNIADNDPRPEFLAVRKYLFGLGLDIGPGSNRLSPTVLCSDWYPHPEGVDLVWNVVHNDGWNPYPFSDNTFDFVFASHVLEDFHPTRLQQVFDELLRMIKPGGYYVILGPCMDGIRYARWDEKFTAEHPDVISGKRQVGELIGNPSHLIDWNIELCNKLKSESRYQTIVVQADTFPTNQMTIDYILQKL